MREAMSMQQLLDQIAEQLPVAAETADGSEPQRDSVAASPQIPSAAEAAVWAKAGEDELEATSLSLTSIRAQAKAMLAAKTTSAARQETLVRLADAALQAARPHSAALVFEMAERRAWKARVLGLALALGLGLGLGLAHRPSPVTLALALTLTPALASALPLTRRARRARRAARC